MVQVLVAGAAGRMGQQIIKTIQTMPKLSLAGAFEAEGHAAIGKDAGEVCGLGRPRIPISAGLAPVLAQGDVLIDFTFHKASIEFARLAAGRGLAMVVGTTGLSGEEEAELQQLANKAFPCVHAANMAVGVNVLFKLVEKTARILGDAYDVEIVEAHHRMKKDAPSGTAITLGKMAAAGLDRNFDEVAVKERNGIIGARTNQEIGIQSIRGGDIVGEHTVYFAGTGERLEIGHRATSRDNFARGAALAAAWVVGKANGMYTMFDVLNLNDL
ncbi:MAG: 4-hydroxy-tetrahydrodipicolinate reductase [Desulfobulbaceae bacterium]|nr:4-hydroxy-tetrahydrodipicolinate reductase [Desulfobulbaceae bacterium]